MKSVNEIEQILQSGSDFDLNSLQILLTFDTLEFRFKDDLTIALSAIPSFKTPLSELDSYILYQKALTTREALGDGKLGELADVEDKDIRLENKDENVETEKEDISGGKLLWVLYGITEIRRQNFYRDAHNVNAPYSMALQYIVSSFESAIRHIVSLFMTNMQSDIMLRIVHLIDKGESVEGEFKLYDELEKKSNIFKNKKMFHLLDLINGIISHFAAGKNLIIEKDITLQDMADVAEIFQSRNLHVHNFGIIDENYSSQLNKSYDVIKNILKTDSDIVSSFTHGHTIINGDFHELSNAYLDFVAARFSSIISLACHAIKLCFSDSDQLKTYHALYKSYTD